MSGLAQPRRACLTKGYAKAPGMNDRDVYLKLAAVAEELLGLSQQAESMIGQTALHTAAVTLAGTAKAIYDHCLGGEEH